ncbi:ARM repeat-containing protein [Westerdykella ornata]|uniref:ARM repeat-containing protein n=1 Tax=Westerdykella ornata TaxID=318751 RepID=A0A6A6JG43_WESOR|nr:ARM repeat-containing protein [Westerdykella ornata]KAF2274169.1 ARM repeat-containing protein [Westerdykella ornata]
MAFSTGIGDRSGLRSPRDESPFGPLTSPLRTVGSQLPSGSTDGRGILTRRFTMNTVPTLNTPLSPIGLQRRQAAEPQEYTTALERKKLEYELLKAQRRRFEAEMELLDRKFRQDEEEIGRLSSDIHLNKVQSQPTTPPEYSDSNGFPTALSRPNRFSMSSVPSGITTPRGSRSGSILASPPSGIQTSSFVPSHSVPGSRRGSDEEADKFEAEFGPISPVFRNTNRLSMPVNLDSRIRESSVGINTTSWLFEREEDKDERNPAASPDAKKYVQMNTTDDKFPILVRRGEGELSASSAALDLALSRSDGLDSQSNGWPTYRHHHAQQSLPTNTLRKGSQVDEYDVSRANGDTTPTRSTPNNRRSVQEFGLGSYGTDSKRSSYASPNGSSVPKFQQSYSTNDVPTLKNMNGMNGMNGINGINGTNGVNLSRTHAEQHLHNHNASLGRIPTNGATNRHSRELSNGFKEQDANFSRPIQSGLHASAAPFGPALTSAPSVTGSIAETIGTPTPSHYSGVSGPYYGYGMGMLTGAMNGLSMGQPVASQHMFNPNGPYPQVPAGMPYYNNPYTAYGPNGRLQDSQARVIQSRRMQSDANRFMNYDLKTMPRAEIYSLCKDQHGCRFLQKKLEERNDEYLQIIFEETAPHVVELMTDPFGNYLCQKLLEYATDEQRDKLVHNAATSLVQIALNQHGTRALQKMIEFISTPKQISMIIEAFQNQVVELIQDLNGNHVIQKCLNHLKAEDAQFIFDAVGTNCVAVGTHRHGCCVLQRCIDHASGFQKVQLVRQITANSFDLVQDPFGNYVVQYILDLNDYSFTNPLCLGFAGKVAELSKQKFSSNVIEKCIRCADMNTKRIMIEELMQEEELEKLMRDSYGNYVIQTALEFAPPDQSLRMIECMRPLLPAIRQTPYGRRIQSKVQERESRLSSYTGRGPGPSPPVAQAGDNGAQGGYPGAPMYTGNAYNSNIASPQPHRMSNPPLPNHLQNSVQKQGYQGYNGGYAQSNGHGSFF